MNLNSTHEEIEEFLETILSAKVTIYEEMVSDINWVAALIYANSEPSIDENIDDLNNRGPITNGFTVTSESALKAATHVVTSVWSHMLSNQQ